MLLINFFYSVTSYNMYNYACFHSSLLCLIIKTMNEPHPLIVNETNNQ